MVSRRRQQWAWDLLMPAGPRATVLKVWPIYHPSLTIRGPNNSTERDHSVVPDSMGLTTVFLVSKGILSKETFFFFNLAHFYLPNSVIYLYFLYPLEWPKKINLNEFICRQNLNWVLPGNLFLPYPLPFTKLPQAENTKMRLPSCYGGKNSFNSEKDVIISMLL